MPSPFKFLDAYTREDRDQFFGREEETAELYELVNQNRLVLLYGPSGTGKTSLIQCGLGNRFEATDWLPLFIRRGQHLPTSLQKALVDKWDEELEGPFWKLDENPLPSIIEDLFAEYLRPIYLVFDQLEEIFVLGDEEERRIFTEAMADIYHAKLPCRLLFILREEYLAHLYDFEQRIPTLFKRRLRVEAMSRNQAEKVVRQSCAKFNISLQDPEKNPGHIIDKISGERSGVPLPYLQVYLDSFYRKDLEDTYPKKAWDTEAPGFSWPALEFTTKEIEDFGEIGEVLKGFLSEQSQSIEADLRNRPKLGVLPERPVRRVLNAFASLEGTKIPQLRSELRVAPLTEAQLDYILERLSQARILREDEGTYELTHDTLAEEIKAQRSGAEEALLQAAELVKSRFKAFKRTQTYLDVKELQLIETYEGALEEEEKLEEEEWEFVQHSKDEARKKRRRRNQLTAGIISVLSLLVVLAFWNWLEARSANSNLLAARNQAVSNADSAAKNEQRAIAANEKAQAALARVQEEQRKTRMALIEALSANLAVVNASLKNAKQLLNRAKEAEMGQGSIRQHQQSINLYAAEKARIEKELDELRAQVADSTAQTP